MHADRRQGVVDENCHLHGLGNLYVVGLPCNRTAGSANTTLTVMALSPRLSDHLKTKLALKGATQALGRGAATRVAIL